MADTDVLDMLFDSHNNSILGLGLESMPSEQHSSTAAPLPAEPPLSLIDNSIDWDSVWCDGVLPLDQTDLFTDLMATNQSDDDKGQQLKRKLDTDHAYSVVNPGSPHSDSGISNGSFSPSSSGSPGHKSAVTTFDLEQELFGPLDLKDYEGSPLSEVDPMMMDTWSDDMSGSPQSADDETAYNFDFDDIMKNQSQPVRDLTITTDENTKVIKVLSVNNSNKMRSQSLLANNKQVPSKSGSTFSRLTLSDEEKNLLRKEGISLPTHLPLTREEEKILRSVRRRIRNKASARNSRRKKQDYMQALEERVKFCTEEKRQLEKKVTALEKHNSSLIGQLRKLQKVVSDSTRQTAKTGTCAMILALSFALVLLPNFQSFLGGSSGEESLMKSAPGGRNTRNLLSKPDDIIRTDIHENTSPNYLPYFNLNKMVSFIAPSSDDDLPEGLDSAFVHDAVDSHTPAADPHTDDIIHMEITKIPEMLDVVVEPAKQASEKVNKSSVDARPPNPDQVIRHRSIKMNLDEL